MGQEIIFHAWKRFVLLSALSKGTTEDGLEKLTLHLGLNRKTGARSKPSTLWYPEGRC